MATRKICDGNGLGSGHHPYIIEPGETFYIVQTQTAEDAKAIKEFCEQCTQDFLRGYREKLDEVMVLTVIRTKAKDR